MTTLAELQKELTAVESSMDKRRAKYIAASLRSETTRARTTTYNADMGRLAERRDFIRAEIGKLTPAIGVNS